MEFSDAPRRLSRRQVLAGFGGLALFGAAGFGVSRFSSEVAHLPALSPAPVFPVGEAGVQAAATPKLPRPATLGVTYSVPQCEAFGMVAGAAREALVTLCDLGLDLIRVCAYWNRVQRRGQFDFAEIDWQLDELAKRGVKGILTVGMKSPRHPEFYFPAEVRDRFPQAVNQDNPAGNRQIAQLTLDYVAKLVEHTRDHPSIVSYQVENEPLNPVLVSSYRYLHKEFVAQEMELVRSLKRPGQRLLLTNSVGGPQTDERMRDTMDLKPDGVGINAYYASAVPNMPPPFNYYNVALAHWEGQIVKWREDLDAAGIEPFVAESQAEPWEDTADVLSKHEFPSANPRNTFELVGALAKVGYRNVLLWGGEFWVAHQNRYGDRYWLNAVRELVAGSVVAPLTAAAESAPTATPAPSPTVPPRR